MPKLEIVDVEFMLSDGRKLAASYLRPVSVHTALVDTRSSLPRVDEPIRPPSPFVEFEYEITLTYRVKALDLENVIAELMQQGAMEGECCD